MANKDCGRRPGQRGRGLVSGRLALMSGLVLCLTQAALAAAPGNIERVAFTAGRPAMAPPIPRRKAARPPTAIELAFRAAKRHGLHPELVHAVILAESLYEPKALSHKGAMGLMQLMPETARRYGVADPWDPVQNIDGGVRYLRDLLAQFGELELVLAAYNAGEKAVIGYGHSVPPYAETEVYVQRALAYIDKLKAGASVAKLKRSGAGIATRLSGWGVIFGSFHDRGEARRTIRQHRKALGKLAAGSRPALVKRNREAGLQYSAVLVGLQAEQAGAACKQLWAQGAYCQALAPRELNDREALWR